MVTTPLQGHQELPSVGEGSTLNCRQIPFGLEQSKTCTAGKKGWGKKEWYQETFGGKFLHLVSYKLTVTSEVV